MNIKINIHRRMQYYDVEMWNILEALFRIKSFNLKAKSNKNKNVKAFFKTFIDQNHVWRKFWESKNTDWFFSFHHLVNSVETKWLLI